MAFLQRETPEFVQDPEDGTFKVKNRTTGHLEPAWMHLFLEAGDDFACYVRRTGHCNDFPYHPEQEIKVEQPNLWPRRKLRLKYFADDPQWTDAQVHSWVEMSSKRDNAPCVMEWMLRVKFDTPPASLNGADGSADMFPAGTLVKIKGRILKEISVNGWIGVITGPKWNARGVYPIFCKHQNMSEKIFTTSDKFDIVSSMEFIVDRINVQGGGVLVPVSSSESSSTTQAERVSFLWEESITEATKEDRWYHAPKTDYSWWKDPFTAEECLDELSQVYKKDFDKCLGLDDDDAKLQALTKIKDETKKALTVLTANGSTEGMRAGFRILLALPVLLFRSAEDELILAAATNNNFYLLELLVRVNYNFSRELTTTDMQQEQEAAKLLLNGFSLELANTNPGQMFVRSLLALLDVFNNAKQYRCSNDVALMNKVKPDPLDLRKALPEMQLLFMSGLIALGDVVRLKQQFVINADWQTEIDRWIGTSGEPAPVSPNSSSETYVPQPVISEPEQNCATCHRISSMPVWCKGCEKIPYCSEKCAKTHWSKGHRIRCCKDEELQKCVLCSQPSNAGCNFCIYTYYCSTECQRMHWKNGHSKDCPRKPLPHPSL